MATMVVGTFFLYCLFSSLLVLVDVCLHMHAFSVRFQSIKIS